MAQNTQSMTQFGQTPIVGQVALKGGQSGSISVQIDSSSAGSLLPGQPVKMVQSVSGGVPRVVECAAVGDDCIGFLNYAPKNASFNALDYAEMSYRYGGNWMWMQSGAAILGDALVAMSISLTTPAVVTAVTGGTNRVVGRCIDVASAAGQFVRVAIDIKSVLLA